MKRIGFLAMLLTTLSAQAEIITIGNDELKGLLAKGVTLVDVRTAGEWNQTGVISGSELVTLVDESGQTDPQAWKSQMAKVADPSQPVILICRSGKRSSAGSKLLDQQSPARKIYNVRDGMNGWQRAALPTVAVPKKS
jgi:rhodanese-related sulfurtransferase